MKLTVLNWCKEMLIPIIGKSVEFVFRSVLCLLPLGIFMLVLQKRKKASAVSSISVYTNERSKFQFVFPGFLLVSIEPNSLDTALIQLKGSFQAWINRNKYVLSFIFMFIVVLLMLLSYIKGI